MTLAPKKARVRDHCSWQAVKVGPKVIPAHCNCAGIPNRLVSQESLSARAVSQNPPRSCKQSDMDLGVKHLDPMTIKWVGILPLTFLCFLRRALIWV